MGVPAAGQAQPVSPPRLQRCRRRARTRDGAAAAGGARAGGSGPRCPPVLLAASPARSRPVPGRGAPPSGPARPADAPPPPPRPGRRLGGRRYSRYGPGLAAEDGGGRALLRSASPRDPGRGERARGRLCAAQRRCGDPPAPPSPPERGGDGATPPPRTHTAPQHRAQQRRRGAKGRVVPGVSVPPRRGQGPHWAHGPRRCHPWVRPGAPVQRSVFVRRFALAFRTWARTFRLCCHKKAAGMGLGHTSSSSSSSLGRAPRLRQQWR